MRPNLCTTIALVLTTGACGLGPDGLEARETALTEELESTRVPAVQRWRGADYAEMFGIYSTPGVPDGERWDGLSYVDHGDWVLYRDVDFGQGNAIARLATSIATPTGGNRVRVILDSLSTGKVVAELATRATGPDWRTFERQEADFADFGSVLGVHDVYLQFLGGSGIGNFEWFAFERLPGPDSVSVSCARSSAGQCSSLFAVVRQKPQDPRVKRVGLSINGTRVKPVSMTSGAALIDFPEPSPGVAATVRVWLADAFGYVSAVTCLRRPAGGTSADLFAPCD